MTDSLSDKEDTVSWRRSSVPTDRSLRAYGSWVIQNTLSAGYTHYFQYVIKVYFCVFNIFSWKGKTKLSSIEFNSLQLIYCCPVCWAVECWGGDLGMEEQFQGSRECLEPFVNRLWIEFGMHLCPQSFQMIQFPVMMCTISYPLNTVKPHFFNSGSSEHQGTWLWPGTEPQSQGSFYAI